MKRAVVFMPPQCTRIGLVFVRAVFTEMGEMRGSWEIIIFVGKK